MKIETKHLLATALASSFVCGAARAEELALEASTLVMRYGEVLAFQTVTYDERDYGRPVAAELNYTPEFNFVIRLVVGMRDTSGTLIHPGLYYCRVGVGRGEPVTFATCTNTVEPEN